MELHHNNQVVRVISNICLYQFPCIDDSRIDKLTAAILWSRDTLSTVVLNYSKRISRYTHSTINERWLDLEGKASNSLLENMFNFKLFINSESMF